MADRSGTCELIRQQEQSDLVAAEIQNRYRATGDDVPRHPNGQDAAGLYFQSLRRFAADQNPNMVRSGTNVYALAMGVCHAQLASAAEDNDWVRKWLLRKHEQMETQLKEQS